MKKGLIIFDFDGTLVDTEKHLHTLWTERIQQILNLPSLEEANQTCNHFRTKYGASLLGLALEENIPEPQKWAEQEKDKLLEKFLSEMSFRLHRNPEIEAMLEDMRADDWELSILSHSPYDYLIKVMAYMNLSQYFNSDLIFGIDTVGDTLKVHPDPYKYVLNAINPPILSEKYMVEDTALNLKEAYNLGLSTVFVGNPDKITDDSYIEEAYPDILTFGETLLENKEAA